MKEFKKARARCIWLDVDDLCSFVPVADHVSTGSAATAENIVESDADAPSVTAQPDVPAVKNAPLKRNRKSSENSDADELCSEKDGSTDVNPPADAPSVTAHTEVPAEKNYPLQRNGKSSENSGSKSSRNNDDNPDCIEEDGSTDVNPAERYMRCVTYDTATTYGRSSIVFCTPGVAAVVMQSSVN
jgi:hypothetical protein